MGHIDVITVLSLWQGARLMQLRAMARLADVKSGFRRVFIWCTLVSCIHIRHWFYRSLNESCLDPLD